MANITYYVSMGFTRDEAGDLVALEPAESQTPSVAISKARSFAATNAGAVAFSRTGDPDVGTSTTRRSFGNPVRYRPSCFEVTSCADAILQIFGGKILPSSTTSPNRG
jgi:hypothetical protein